MPRSSGSKIFKAAQRYVYDNAPRGCLDVAGATSPSKKIGRRSAAPDKRDRCSRTTRRWSFAACIFIVYLLLLKWAASAFTPWYVQRMMNAELLQDIDALVTMK